MSNPEKFISIISQPQRTRILKFLQKQCEATVTEIHKALRMPQNLCSHHLAVLLKAGAVTVKQEGKFRFYMANTLVILNKIESFYKIFE